MGDEIAERLDVAMSLLWLALWNALEKVCELADRAAVWIRVSKDLRYV